MTDEREKAQFGPSKTSKCKFLTVAGAAPTAPTTEKDTTALEDRRGGVGHLKQSKTRKENLGTIEGVAPTAASTEEFRTTLEDEKRGGGILKVAIP